MKKIISMALALIMSALVFCACASQGGVKEEQTVQETQNLPSYVGQEDADYDVNGNYILTSTDNRKVYPYDSGYVVFKFNGEAVAKITRVLEFEDEVAAGEYLTSAALAQVENGEVPTTMVQNGVHVIVNVGFDTEEGGLGSYYTKGKSDIMTEFESAEEDH